MNSKEFPKIPAAALWARLPVQGLFASAYLARNPLAAYCLPRPTTPSIPAALTPVWQSVGVASKASAPNGL